MEHATDALDRLGMKTTCPVCGETGAKSLCTGCRSISFCGKACQALAWPSHKEECRRLRKERAKFIDGIAAAYAADEAIAAEVCRADVPKGAECYICGNDKYWNGDLVRGCSCRTHAGFVHIRCLVAHAEVRGEDGGDQAFTDSLLTCSLCRQPFKIPVSIPLKRATWLHFAGRDDTDASVLARSLGSLLSSLLAWAGYLAGANTRMHAAAALRQALALMPCYTAVRDMRANFAVKLITRIIELKEYEVAADEAYLFVRLDPACKRAHGLLGTAILHTKAIFSHGDGFDFPSAEAALTMSLDYDIFDALRHEADSEAAKALFHCQFILSGVRRVVARHDVPEEFCCPISLTIMSIPSPKLISDK